MGVYPRSFHTSPLTYTMRNIVLMFTLFTTNFSPFALSLSKGLGQRFRLHQARSSINPRKTRMTTQHWRNTILLTLLCALDFSARAMDFELRPILNSSPERAQLVMAGTVRGTELEQLKSWLAQHPEIDTILLKNSNGGNAAAGYAVGEFIRERGLATGLIGRCASSCSRMFLGGKKRFFTFELPPEKTMIGFHGNYGADGKLLPGRSPFLKAWVIKHLGWNEEQHRQFESLVDLWVNIETNAGMLYFFDEEKTKNQDGSSVVYCRGNEPNQSDRLAACERKPMVTARRIGLITTER
ncbi:MAG: hypothetical protein HEQ39_14845 [Rhizobacter sp.]